MFTNISWTNYLIVIALLVTAWYIITCLRFYFQDLKNLFTVKRKFSFQKGRKEFSFNQPEQITNPELSDSNDNYFFNREETDNLFKIVEDLLSKLKEAISDAVSKNYTKEEFSFLLQLTLKEYPMLKGSPFQVAINNLIASECEKHSFIPLSAVELMMLWNEVVL